MRNLDTNKIDSSWIAESYAIADPTKGLLYLYGSPEAQLRSLYELPLYDWPVGGPPVVNSGMPRPY